VLRENEAVLMVRRAPAVAKGGCWCFPGGHVESGETSRRAIERELLEELGLLVRAVERLGAIRVDDRYVLAVWFVCRVGGSLRPDRREIAEARWVDPTNLRELRPSLHSNEAVFDMLGV
jgi:mutator protein MutT